MSHNTRSQGARSRIESDPQSEGEVEILKMQALEKERQLKEQAEALIRQRKDFEKERDEFIKSKANNSIVDDISTILNSIQGDLSELKSLSERFLNLEHRFDDFQDKVTNPNIMHTDQEQFSFLQDPLITQEQINADKSNLISMTEHPKRSHSVPTQNITNFQATTTNPFQYPSANLSNSSIRDALELVPKFDGHNMPVLQFARSCKRAKELIPLTNEDYLLRLLRNKLTGHAYLAVEDEIHHTVDQFIDSLKRVFGPICSPNYYRGQLSINFKKPSEHILDYIGRVKDLRNSIIEGDQAQARTQ